MGRVLGGRYVIDRRLHHGRRNDLFVGHDGRGERARRVVVKVPHQLSDAALAGELAGPGGRLRDCRRDVSVELDEVVAIALAEDSRERFESALLFQDALTRALLVRR